MPVTRDNAIALVELAAVGAVAVLGFPITPLIALLVLASVSLLIRAKGWSDVGLRADDGIELSIGAGAVLGTVALLATAWAWGPALTELTGRAVELNHLPPLRGQAGLLVTATILAVATAFAAEMVFRGWLLERFRGLLGSDALAVVASAAAYAAVIAEPGLAPTLGAMAMGVGYGFMYLAGGRNLALPIAFHAAFDVTNLVLIYLKVVG